MGGRRWGRSKPVTILAILSLSFMASLFLAAPVHAATALVQSNTNTCSGCTSITVASPGNAGSGNLLAITMSWASAVTFVGATTYISDESLQYTAMDGTSDSNGQATIMMGVS